MTNVLENRTINIIQNRKEVEAMIRRLNRELIEENVDVIKVKESNYREGCNLDILREDRRAAVESSNMHHLMHNDIACSALLDFVVARCLRIGQSKYGSFENRNKISLTEMQKVKTPKALCEGSGYRVINILLDEICYDFYTKLDKLVRTDDTGMPGGIYRLAVDEALLNEEEKEFLIALICGDQPAYRFKAGRKVKEFAWNLEHPDGHIMIDLTWFGLLWLVAHAVLRAEIEG